MISAAQKGRVQGFVERAAGKKHIEIVTGGKVVNSGDAQLSATVPAGGENAGDVVVGTIKVQGLADGMPVRETKAATLAAHSP